LRGIFIERFEYESDGARQVLDPEPDLMILPTPVQQGEQSSFDTVGVDARNFGTVRHVGYVKERRRVDVCGKVIDSWFVDGEQTFTFGTARRRNFDYGIATHLGGLIVFEHVQNACGQSNSDGSCTPPADIEYDTNLAQLEPGT
jgi:hypothetical protein